MKNILWLGKPFFARELENCGWEKAHVIDFEDCRPLSWQDIIDFAGFEPDVLVVAGGKRLPPILGMENFPCLTVFYSLAAQANSWEPLYAQGFDACLISQRGHSPRFVGRGLGSDRIWWSPPFAASADQPAPETEKIWDCLFIGSRGNHEMTGGNAFLRALGNLSPELKVMEGDDLELFAKARVIVNHAAPEDSGFREFAAMGRGCCLVTPRGDQMQNLFIDGEHLVGYAPDDAGDAAYRINFLLSHPDVASHIAAAGLEEINARHRAMHRAQAFTDHLCDLAIMGGAELAAARVKEAAAIRREYLADIYESLARDAAGPMLKASLLAAAKDGA